MVDPNDMDLVREYADRNSEPAFAELVRRHINLVYSIALRFTGNPQDAQDVTQAVFVILAQKAHGLRAKTILTGWLYETTRFTAKRFLRSQVSRQLREQKASMSSINDSNLEIVWRQLAPLLEEAVARLSEKERTLIALRFFENKSAAETATLLGIQEWAARKRAERALEKLRNWFAKRGITSTAATIAGAISVNSVQAAPVALASTATAIALANRTTASASTVTLVKGALKIMAWTKAKTTVLVGVGVLAILTVPIAFRGSSKADIHTMTAAQIHELFTGNWMQQDSLGSLVLHAKGGFNRRLRQESAEWLYEGTWDVKDGVLVLNISNAVARNATSVEAIGTTDNFRISKVDRSHLVLEKDGITTDFHR